jgi:hypothetical protein
MGKNPVELVTRYRETGWWTHEVHRARADLGPAGRYGRGVGCIQGYPAMKFGRMVASA